MCGIVGYIGPQEAQDVLIDGLRRLEYRGYDSAGVAILHDGDVEIRRTVGKLINLEKSLFEKPVPGKVGIGHTRWATHGRPSETNAHPHRHGPVVLVHNGIIENYLELKKILEDRGHNFQSETDTEVVCCLVTDEMRRVRDSLPPGACALEAGVAAALRQVEGSYALAALSLEEPEVLVAAKKGSPLIVGLAAGETLVASDIPALLAYTRDVVILEDEEMAVVRPDGTTFRTVGGEPVERPPKRIAWDLVQAEKGGYKHFMLKEIHEQPQAVVNTLAGRILREKGDVFFEDLMLPDEELREIERMVLVACGTAWHAALVGKFLVEKLARLPVEVDLASEFRYRDPIINGSRTLLMAVSQSGETADTIAAIREGQEKGARTAAICNVIDSTIARLTGGVIYTHAGPEIGVASTKAFTTQLVAFALFAVKLGRLRGALSEGEARLILEALAELPGKIEEALKCEEKVQEVAHRHMNARNFLFLGRGINYPIALEGALKLKEISYIHAEGYPAGEMKHGPIALIDRYMPVVVVAQPGPQFDKVMNNLAEVQAREAPVILVTSDALADRVRQREDVVTVPEARAEIEPILFTVPLQLLAYHIAHMTGKDVDQPRNLAKSVTVE